MKSKYLLGSTFLSNLPLLHFLDSLAEGENDYFLCLAVPKSNTYGEDPHIGHLYQKASKLQVHRWSIRLASSLCLRLPPAPPLSSAPDNTDHHVCCNVQNSCYELILYFHVLSYLFYFTEKWWLQLTKLISQAISGSICIFQNAPLK